MNVGGPIEEPIKSYDSNTSSICCKYRGEHVSASFIEDLVSFRSVFHNVGALR